MNTNTPVKAVIAHIRQRQKKHLLKRLTCCDCEALWNALALRRWVRRHQG